MLKKQPSQRNKLFSIPKGMFNQKQYETFRLAITVAEAATKTKIPRNSYSRLFSQENFVAFSRQSKTLNKYYRI